MERRLDGGESDARGGGLRLVSELHLGEAREHDADACAAVLGSDGMLAPGGTVVLRTGARCGIAFVPFRDGDRVQLRVGASCG